jgi:hypothetical protein
MDTSTSQLHPPAVDGVSVMFGRILVLLAFTVGVAAVQSASAGIKISRNNPYRSFNTSGVNFGSMQWEKQQAAKRYRSGSRANGRR